MSSKWFSCVLLVAYVLIVCNAQRQYNPYLKNPYYRNLYYRNRDLYNQRRYYDNFYKQYNPFVPNVQARILENSNTANHGSGAYTYSYETENGIHAEERGVPVDIGNGEQEEQIEGAYSFLTPEGLRVGVKYVADANGFRPIVTYDGVNSAFYAAQPAAANVVYTKH